MYANAHVQDRQDLSHEQLMLLLLHFFKCNFFSLLLCYELISVTVEIQKDIYIFFKNDVNLLLICSEVSLSCIFLFLKTK